MGGFALIGGKRQTVRIKPETLREIAGLLGIEPRSEVTAISIAISSSPSAGAAARSRPRGRSQGSTPGASDRPSARRTRTPRQT